MFQYEDKGTQFLSPVNTKHTEYSSDGKLLGRKQLFPEKLNAKKQEQRQICVKSILNSWENQFSKQQEIEKELKC